MTYPSLTPTYSLGSGSRTAGSILIGSRNSKIGTVGRIYNSLKTYDQKQQFIYTLINTLPPFPQNYNRWSLITT